MGCAWSERRDGSQPLFRRPAATLRDAHAAAEAAVRVPALAWDDFRKASAAGYVELLIDLAEVEVHRVPAQKHLLRDLDIACSLCRQRGDSELLLSQICRPALVPSCQRECTLSTFEHRMLDFREQVTGPFKVLGRFSPLPVSAEPLAKQKKGASKFTYCVDALKLSNRCLEVGGRIARGCQCSRTCNHPGRPGAVLDHLRYLLELMSCLHSHVSSACA